MEVVLKNMNGEVIFCVECQIESNSGKIVEKHEDLRQLELVKVW